MLLNGISFVGWISVAVGWGLLILSPGLAGTRTVNLHSLAIADAAIMSGFALVIIGVLNEGLGRRSATPAARAPDPTSPSDSPKTAPESAAVAKQDEPVPYFEGDAPDFTQLKKTHSYQKGLFSSIEIFEMNYGLFIARTASGWRSFKKLEDARAVLENDAAQG